MRIGKVTESVLDRSVLKILKENDLISNNSKKKGAAVRPDCAFSIDEEIAGSVSTFTADASNGGYYAVHNAANNLFAGNAEPDFAILDILLAESTEEKELKEIVRSCTRAANELGIVISGGHTETTDALSRPLVSVTVCGKSIAPSEDVHVKENSSIIMTKWAGIEGTAILSQKYKDRLEKRFPVPFLYEAGQLQKYISVREDARISYEVGAKLVHDVSSGGIFAALWELSGMCRMGIDVDLKKIPIKQETVEITNELGINPYQMHSGGSLLFVTENETNAILKLEEAGIPAVVIGSITGNNNKIIRNDDEIRFLDKPAADEILKKL